jgi:hypothetical protein
MADPKRFMFFVPFILLGMPLVAQPHVDAPDGASKRATVSDTNTPNSDRPNEKPEHDRDETPDTPPTEPPPVPVQDPPATPGPEGPYVVTL